MTNSMKENENQSVVQAWKAKMPRVKSLLWVKKGPAPMQGNFYYC
jgi:hypothetical protein